MLTFEFIPHTLHFNFDARTSRGSLKQINTIYLKITDENGVESWGECCRIPGLSIDDNEEYLNLDPGLLNKLQNIPLNSADQILEDISSLVPKEFTSLKMCLETALLDLFHGGKQLIFNEEFHAGDKMIPINGLIWMGHSEDMLKQINERLYEGFTCIKLKIGGIDFDVECDILDYVRRRYFKQEITVRLDANGSFDSKTGINKLHRLAAFNIHSIEQPLKAGDPDLPGLVKESPIPIALDEELIGVHDSNEREELLKRIQPAYLVLKPSLLGGFSSTRNWIELAEKHNIGWWITSALESNIGLNAIAQFAAGYQNDLPQGLGTGRLYTNNIISPLTIKESHLFWNPGKEWKFELSENTDG